MSSASDGGAFNPDGPVAAEIAVLWWVMLALSVAVFAVFTVALVAALVRRRREGDAAAADPRVLRRWVVGGGVVMPTVVLIVVLVFTIAAMRSTPAAAPPGALRIEIVGHQWRYEIHYPEQDITTTNELHIPVGRPVEFRLTSADVIHSFWVPRLAGKMDLLPDKTNVLVLQADEPGEHRTVCAEFCGLRHADMRLLVVAESEDDFAAWVAANEDAAAP
ncbi:MAG: cytochrome c oxidase subunit II [Actinomycetota bacterium]|nr:cytochrome c oxidase subunit II [Actinomycetota bacterium]